MSKQKREKLTTTKKPEKSSQNKSLVQIEGELTQVQLETIAGGGIETSPKP